MPSQINFSNKGVVDCSVCGPKLIIQLLMSFITEVIAIFITVKLVVLIRPSVSREPVIVVLDGR